MDDAQLRALLDPEIRAVLDRVPMDMSGLSAMLPAVRAGLAARPTPDPSPGVLRSEPELTPVDGVLRTLRVHRPAGEQVGLRPCLLWMHAGGLVMGSSRIDDARLDDWCSRWGLVTVSVDYRLAPEAQYPAPLDDCHDALRWVLDHAGELGVDPARIGVGGASAGGGLAAAVTSRARRDGIELAFQLLLYPMLDDRMTTPSSGWPDPVWPPAANRFAWDAYLGDRASAEVPAEAAMARETDLGRLPRAFVGVGSLDGFSDEAVGYAERLRHAGVRTELHVYDGAPHGFDGIAPLSAVAGRLVADVQAWLGGVLGATSA